MNTFSYIDATYDGQVAYAMEVDGELLCIMTNGSIAIMSKVSDFESFLGSITVINGRVSFVEYFPDEWEVDSINQWIKRIDSPEGKEIIRTLLLDFKSTNPDATWRKNVNN